MNLLVALLAVAVVGSVASLVAGARRRARHARWREAARLAGLTDIRESEGFLVPTSLTGRAGDLRVTLQTYHRGKYHHGTRISVRGMRHPRYSLRLRGEGFSSSLEKALGEREIEIGDPAFDDAVYVQGQAPLARAVLDAATRREVAALLSGRVPGGGGPGEIRARLAEDVLEVECRERPFALAPELPRVLSAALDTARRLVAPADVAPRIAENLKSETEPRVRRQLLLTLIREFPDHPSTREASRRACDDPDDDIRLRAAIALGEEGRGALESLASGETTDDAVAGRAIEALDADLGTTATLRILATARRAGRARTAQACLAVLGRHGGEDAVPALAEALSDEAGTLAIEAARALGATGSPVAEEPLLHALGRANETLRVAAAESLARVGTTRSVLPLREAASRHPGGGLRGAVRQAIATIQSRQSGAVPGQVSLAAGEAGALSLSVGASAGGLSLTGGEGEGGGPRSPGPRAFREDEEDEPARPASPRASREGE